MDGNGQQQDAQRQMMDQRQPPQQWYGAPQNPYQQQQQAQGYKWPGYDPAMHYAHPPMQSYGQPDYYMQQQQQHYATSLPQQPQVQQQQHAQHQYYAQQPEQVWPSNNGWNETQWNQQVSTTTGSEEEDWAAKARAWAAAKAAQETAQQAAQQAHAQAQAEAQAQAQSQAQAHLMAIPQQEQIYHDYQQQAPQAVQRPAEVPQQPSVIPPGQESSQQGIAQDAPTGYGHNGHSYPQEPPPVFGQDNVAPSLGQDGTSSSYAQAAHAQVVPSSYSQDVSSSYGQDTAIAAPPGTEQHEQSDQMSAHLPPTPALPQPQQPQLAAQVSPHSQSQQFSYQDPVPPPAFEFQQMQQFDYQQPPPQDYQQQPTAPYLPPVPTMGMDGAEMNFGGAPNAMSGWPPLGGPFPPNMGPGRHPGPQFDHPHHNQHPHHMHGPQPPHMFPRHHGPQHGPGFRPPGPPLGGPFGFGGPPSLGPGPMGPVFLPDGNGNLGGPDRPKKAPVPSWLREELLKKKSTVGISSSAALPMSDDFVRMNGDDPIAAVPHKLGLPERTRSDSSGMSDNDEDDEDEKEAARTAAMNQEIKRVLTEVLLKVTDDLFEEIAQEVMEEDDLAEGQGGKATSEAAKQDVPHSTPSPSPPTAPVIPAPARLVVAPVKRSIASSGDDSDNDSKASGVPLGNVLGLATYASDEEDVERRPRNDTPSVDPESSTEEPKRVGKIEEKRGRDKTEDKTGDHKGGRPLREDIGDGRKAHSEGARNSLPLAEKERKDKKDREREKDKRDLDGGKKEKERDRHRGRDREAKGREKPTEMDEKEHRSEGKGKKRSNDDNESSDPGTRSPRRARHTEAQHLAIDADLSIKDKGESGKHGKSGNLMQKKATDTQSEMVDVGEQTHRTGHGRTSAGVKEVKMDVNHERASKEIKVQSVDDSIVVLTGAMRGRVESTDVPGKKSRDTEDGNKEREHPKHHSNDAAKEKVDRSREKDKGRSKDQAKENDKVHEKEKSREIDRDRSKGERGKDRGRVHQRDRRKTEKDRVERGRDRRKESKDTKRSRRRSSSSSSRGRSRSRSSSGSRGSSSDLDKGKSPKQRRPPARLRRRPSLSPSPVRSRRRRPSRSRSRSPPSKYSHRRHSPSPSRETERRR